MCKIHVGFNSVHIKLCLSNEHSRLFNFALVGARKVSIVDCYTELCTLFLYVYKIIIIIVILYVLLCCFSKFNLIVLNICVYLLPDTCYVYILIIYKIKMFTYLSVSDMCTFTSKLLSQHFNINIIIV